MPNWKLTITETITAPTREEAILGFDAGEGFDTEYEIVEVPDPWVTSTPILPEDSDSEDPDRGVPRDAESDPAWGIGSKS